MNWPLAETTADALVDDALATSHPLSSSKRVTALPEIDAFFDAISCGCLRGVVWPGLRGSGHPIYLAACHLMRV